MDVNENFVPHMISISDRPLPLRIEVIFLINADTGYALVPTPSTMTLSHQMWILGR